MYVQSYNTISEWHGINLKMFSFLKLLSFVLLFVYLMFDDIICLSYFDAIRFFLKRHLQCPVASL